MPTTSDCVKILAKAYNMNIKHIMDKHAPQQTKIIFTWYKRMMRRCERKYNKSKLKDRQTYFKQCKSLYKMLNNSKGKCFPSKIKQHEGNGK